MKKIVVIGATGMLGTPVTVQLSKAGYQVTAMVRNIDKAQKKLPSEINLVRGDLKNVNDLKAAFADQDYIYLSLSTAPNEKNKTFKTEIEGIQNVIHAAAKTGIQRIGYLSSIVKAYNGFDWWVFDIKRMACDLLNSSDIPTTIYKPSNFFVNLTDLLMAGSNMILIGHQQTKSWWLSAHDYGKMVAKSFEVDEGNQEYTLQGPEPFSFDEAVDLFIEHYPHKKLTKRRIPLWLMKIFGKFSTQADYGWRITEAINQYPEEFKGDETWQKLGKPEITLKEFARNA